MLSNAVFAAAGLAEFSPEETRVLDLKIATFMMTPFILYSIGVVLLLTFLLWTPARRQRWTWRSLSKLLVSLAALGLVLLVPALLFMFPLSLSR